MGEKTPLTKDRFCRRFADLCLKSGLMGFPKSDIDQQILLKSAALVLGQAPVFTEQEINEKLKYWVDQVARIQGIDHGTLRRFLVDNGYLTRSDDGSAYYLAPAETHAALFDPQIEQMDVAAVIVQAREEMEARKRAYMQKSG